VAKSDPGLRHGRLGQQGFAKFEKSSCPSRTSLNFKPSGPLIDAACVKFYAVLNQRFGRLRFGQLQVKSLQKKQSLPCRRPGKLHTDQKLTRIISVSF